MTVLLSGNNKSLFFSEFVSLFNTMTQEQKERYEWNNQFNDNAVKSKSADLLAKWILK